MCNILFPYSILTTSLSEAISWQHSDPELVALRTGHEKSFDHSDEDILSNERDIATYVISVDDDPTLNPWTFRSFFLGLGLSAFGGVLGQLFSCL